ncbi:MAG: hypothetical protein EOM22_11310 [Gammaproteobacteria bacterium]|nr:hypothetical protein [Gammaproteobacteria bacterium]
MTHSQKPAVPQRLATRAEIRDAGVAIAQATRRELLWLGSALDPDLCNTSAFVDAVKRLALAHPVLPVRILLSDPRAARQTGHRIIALAQRLTSRIAIRRLCEDTPERTDAFLVGDARTYLKWPRADGAEGIVDMYGRREARRLRLDFEQLWERSDADLEMRRLDL